MHMHMHAGGGAPRTVRRLEQQYDEVGEDEEERRGDGDAERDATAGHAEGARRVRLGAAQLHEGEEEERHVHLSGGA